MTGYGVINRNSFGVKAVSCTSWTVHGNECCGQCQNFELQEGGAEGKKKCAWGFCFGKYPKPCVMAGPIKFSFS